MVIIENYIVCSNKYFILPNKFLKFCSHSALALRSVAAFAALAGSFFSLLWLEQQNANRLPQAAAWEGLGPLVIVDAGHGGHDGGAVANGVVEKEMALDLAQRLKRELEDLGLRVRMTRNEDVFLPLQERAALTAKHEAAAFVSVHLNTDGEGSSAEGIETYYAEPSLEATRQNPAAALQAEASAKFAAFVQRLVCASTRAENRGTKARGYAVVARAACPAVLVECGFITSTTEVKRLKKEAYRDQVAAGIAKGLRLYLQTRAGSAEVLATAVK